MLGICNGVAEGEIRHTNYAYGCLIACIVLELASIGCTIPYYLDHDETDSSLPLAAFILVAIGVVGQLLSCITVWCINYITKSRSNVRSVKLCTYGIGLLSLPSLGLVQLAATMLMAVNTANNDDSDVQGFGSAIIGLNFAATLLAVSFGIFFYIPMEDKNYKPLSE